MSEEITVLQKLKRYKELECKEVKKVTLDDIYEKDALRLWYTNELPMRLIETLEWVERQATSKDILGESWEEWLSEAGYAGCARKVKKLLQGENDDD